jgi:prepilin-type N-terminal cleavage/methylation domain-containing protein/prepilin-type processing-associated H-X9-DG protein
MMRVLIRAFTLIEILVVISIIGVLLAIMLPGLRAARERARSIVCTGNLRNLGFAIQIYTGDNNGWLPPAEPRDKDDAASPDNWYFNPDLMACMNVAAQRDANGLIVGPEAEGTILICPSHARPNYTRAVLPDYPAKYRPYALSYMMNGTWRLSNRGGKTGARRHILEFPKLSKTLVAGDGNGYERARAIVLYEACPSHNFEYRHGGKINLLYLDKHVDSLKKDDVPMGRQSRYEYFWSEKKR